MTEEQGILIAARLAVYQIKLAGMIAENTWRQSVGQSMAYAEDSFLILADKLEKEIAALQGEKKS